MFRTIVFEDTIPSVAYTPWICNTVACKEGQRIMSLDRAAVTTLHVEDDLDCISFETLIKQFVVYLFRTCHHLLL